MSAFYSAVGSIFPDLYGVRTVFDFSCRTVLGQVNGSSWQRFSNWGPRTKGGPWRVPRGSARGFQKV